MNLQVSFKINWHALGFSRLHEILSRFSPNIGYRNYSVDDRDIIEFLVNTVSFFEIMRRSKDSFAFSMNFFSDAFENRVNC